MRSKALVPMRRSVVLFLFLCLVLLLTSGSVVRAESLPTKCICDNGQPLHYDSETDYMVQVWGWLLAGSGYDWKGCYEDCVRKCGCDPTDPDLTCSYNCIIGTTPTRVPAPTLTPTEGDEEINIDVSYRLGYKLDPESQGAMPLTITFTVQSGPPGTYISKIRSITQGWDVFHSGEEVKVDDPTPTTLYYGYWDVDLGDAWMAATDGVPIAFEAVVEVFAGYDGFEQIFKPITVRFDVHIHGVTPEMKWGRLMELYNSTIPRGLTGNGNWNNWCELFDKKHNEYLCGGYQIKVLILLDNLKFSDNPNERALLDDYDYGPIEAYYGGHQAVVIYPKGTSWVETGIVFDPWPNQRPEVFTIMDWADRFSLGTFHGIGGSSPYAQIPRNPGYPTVGGFPVDPAKLKPLTEAENKAYQALPDDIKALLRKIKVEENRNYIIRRAIQKQKSGRVMGNSPVYLYVIDGARRKAGFPSGIPTLEMPGVEIRAYPKEDGTLRTEIAFQREEGYTLMIEGTGTGTAIILDGSAMQEPDYAHRIYKYQLPVSAGTKGSLDLRSEGAPLDWCGQAVPGRLTSDADDAATVLPHRSQGEWPVLTLVVLDTMAALLLAGVVVVFSKRRKTRGK